MERVLIIGSPGAGKSTLAFALAEATGLPLIHLDREYWQPGWTEPDKAAWRAKVAELAARPRWIMEGNYGATLDLRLPRADTVILLDLPMPLCLWRVIKRWWIHRGSTRPEMGNACPERLDWGFLWYVVRFPWSGRRRNARDLAAFRGRLIRLTSQGAIDRRMQSVGDQDGAMVVDGSRRAARLPVSDG